MKRLLGAAVMSLSVLLVPTAVTHAAGPPPPDCVPEGNLCIQNYSAQYTDANGYTISAQWTVDRNSGNIESVSPSLSPASPCGAYYSPSNPNTSPYQGPVTVWYIEPGSTATISIELYNNGSAYGSSGTYPTPCP
jgi:hypothetical protein